MVVLATPLNNYIEKVKEGQSIVKFIESKSKELKEEQIKIKNATDSQEKSNISDHISGIITQTVSQQSEMKKILEYLQNSINEAEDKNKENVKKSDKEDDRIMTEKNTEMNEAESNEIEKRIKQNLFVSLVKNYSNACSNLQKEESAVKYLIQKNYINTAEIAKNGELTEEEKRKILEDPILVQTFYEKKLKGNAPVTLKNQVSDLEDRHKDILRLQKGIKELHVLVLQFSRLVNQQGQMIDNICDNINSAKDYVLKGEQNIIKAKTNIQKARNKKCCIIVILAIVAALIVVIPIAIKFS